MRNSVEKALEVCPVEVAVAILGGSWKLSIVKELLERGTLRTAQLHRSIPLVSERTLTRQLRELEQDGIIDRTVYPQVPPRVEYSLTPIGNDLQPIVDAMNSWGSTFAARIPKANGPASQ